MDGFKNIAIEESVDTPVVGSSSPRRRLSFPKFRYGRKAKIASGIIVVAVLLFIVFGLLPVMAAYKSAQKLQVSAQKLQAAGQSQDLDQINAALADTKNDLRDFDRNLGRLAWTQVVPVAGSYWKDARAAARGGTAGVEAGEIVVKTIEPYSDILGFNGGPKALDGAQTAEDRINFIVKTIGGVVPQLDSISAKTGEMQKQFNQVDPNRYPEYFQGKPVRESVRKGIELVNEMHELVTGGKPVLEQAPYLLGVDKERTYLLIFQNDKELRPTGGFITAYSIVKVKDGKFNPVQSNDIYNLDDKLKSKIPAPDPIKKYLPLVPYWYMRDMNISPDFKTSMDTFKENYDKTKSPQVDGIIAIDTHVAVDILKVIGKIGVPGFGNYSADTDPRCNCPNVVYELESYADIAGPIVWADDLGGKIVFKPANSDNRKAVLGPLMNSIMSNALGQPKEKLPDLFEAGFNAMTQKHVLFYFGEGEVQKAMESFNLAGRIREYDGDYLHINDTNFAGAKSNLYVEENVELKVDKNSDGTTNTLTIKYANPQKHDGWLNGPYRDWVRVYVPKGSTLIDSSGSEVPVTTYDELGKTVFEGFMTLRPQGVLQLTFKYKTPVKAKNYKLMVQKQPGTGANLYNVSQGRNKEEFQLETDKELRF
jgi:hypothetical protein